MLETCPYNADSSVTSSLHAPPAVGAGFKPALTQPPQTLGITSATRRKAIRLPEFDYTTPGAYFITVCTFGRQLLLEHPGFRRIVEDTWTELPGHYTNLHLDAFVVMPNHIHGILFLDEAPSRSSLTEIIRAFKTFSARRVNLQRRATGLPVWQRNYYEHVIRSEPSLAAIQEYIADNPRRWEEDHENPEARLTGAEKAFWQAILGKAPCPSHEGQV